MALRINPARLPLWRDSNTLQLGMGREAITITNVRADEERLINLLFRGIPEKSLDTLSKTVGIDSPRAEQLMSRLRPALLERVELQTGPALTDEFVQQAFAEIIRASFEHNRDGQTVVAKRSIRGVTLANLDRVTLALALGLAASGIGNLTCLDSTPVSIADTGSLGFDRSFLGIPKSQALAALIGRTVQPAQVTFSRTRNSDDLLIASAHHPLSQADLLDLFHDQTTRVSLVIELGIETSRVSPVLVPAISPCLDCRNIKFADKDSNWAGLASQLRSRKERLDDSQTALLCAGLALEKALRFLDGLAPNAFESNLLDHRSGMIFNESWGWHPDCGCKK